MVDVVYMAAKARDLDLLPLLQKLDVPKPFAVVTTIQFLDEVKKLESDGYTVLGQILGCNTGVVKGDFASFVYIGTGRFHPLNLAFSQDKPVYTLDPLTEEQGMISEDTVLRYHRKRKGMTAKYLQSTKIGIIVSLKSGQNQMKRALRLKKKLDAEGKKESYIFLCDNVGKMEDYNDIQCWVNTACVRIIEDTLPVPLVNIRDVEGF